jgi:hypothetical protein
VSGKASGATVAFLSEDLIAIGRHAGTDLTTGTLSIVQWKAGTFTSLTTKSLARYLVLFGGLFRVTDGRFISTLEGRPQLLSPDLTLITDITNVKTIYFVPAIEGSNVAGDSRLRDWKVYGLAPTPTLLRQGTGQLLSLSDNVLVLRVNDEIQIETIAGDHLGSFAVPPQSSTDPRQPACSTRVRLLGHNRLYLSGCGPGRVVDFTGRMTVQVPEPDGWPIYLSLDRGWSSSAL